MGSWASILANSQAEQPQRMAQLSSLIQQQQNAPLQHQALQQQVQAGGLENQQRQQQIQMQQRAMQDQQTIMQAMQQNPGKTFGDILPTLQGKVMPQTIAQLSEADTKMREGYSKLKDEEFKQHADQQTANQKLYNDAMNMAPGDFLNNWPNFVQAVNAVPGNKGMMNLDPAKPMSQQQFQQLGPMVGLNGAYLTAEQARRTAAANQTEAEGKAAEAQAKAQEAAAQAGMVGKKPGVDVPYAPAVFNQLKSLKPNLMTQGNQLGGGDALDMAAEYYRKTGTLPAGFGRSPQTTAAVIKRAAEQAKAEGGDAGDIAQNKLTFQSQKDAVNYFVKGKGGQQLTAFKTAITHLDLLDKLGDDLNNTNLQIVNKAKQAWAQQTGNPAPANFEAAKNAMAGEVASALKASGATDQEIAKVSGTFDRAQGPAQLKGAIATYRQLLGSKRDKLKEQYDSAMKGQVDFGGGEAPAQGGGQHVAGGAANGLKEGQTGTGSDGKKYIVKGGTWVAQ